MADQPTRQLGGATRAAREVAAGAYAALDLCPWCKKGLGKVIPNASFCPACHKDILAWRKQMEAELESHQKGVYTSNMMDKKAKEADLFRKIREDGMVNKAMPRKANNRE